MRTSFRNGAREVRNELLENFLSINALLVFAVVVDGTRDILQPDSNADHPVSERPNCSILITNTANITTVVI